jgi:formylglycine-generating enzyme required for sulfatase activity
MAFVPVEQVSWVEAEQLLVRLHLRLPTETEWEYACRCGAPGKWWFGDDPALLARHANLADLSASKLDLWFAKSNVHVSWDDGWPLLAPVGSFAANRFGLHDMVGNVAEWCAGGLTVYPGNQGFLVVEGTRVHRGGSFRSDSVRARSTARYIEPETNRSTDIGVRPAASLVGVRRR